MVRTNSLAEATFYLPTEGPRKQLYRNMLAEGAFTPQRLCGKFCGRGPYSKCQSKVGTPTQCKQGFQGHISDPLRIALTVIQGSLKMARFSIAEGLIVRNNVDALKQLRSDEFTRC